MSAMDDIADAAQVIEGAAERAVSAAQSYVRQGHLDFAKAESEKAVQRLGHLIALRDEARRRRESVRAGQ